MTISVELLFRKAKPRALHLDPGRMLSDDEFLRFCRENKPWQIEREPDGNLTIMPPCEPITSNRNAGLTSKLFDWTEKDGTGTCLDSSGGFTLPNDAIRGPDATWYSHERWNALSEAEQKKAFPRIVPEFVIELRSPSNTLASLKKKMEEYRDNGVVLGWLINPPKKEVHIYRDDGTIEVLKSPKSVSGDPVLKGFTLPTKYFWS